MITSFEAGKVIISSTAGNSYLRHRYVAQTLFDLQNKRLGRQVVLNMPSSQPLGQEADRVHSTCKTERAKAALEDGYTIQKLCTMSDDSCYIIHMYKDTALQPRSSASQHSLQDKSRTEISQSEIFDMKLHIMLSSYFAALPQALPLHSPPVSKSLDLQVTYIAKVQLNQIRLRV